MDFARSAVLGCVAIALSAWVSIASAQQARALDTFDEASDWRVVTSNQVTAELRSDDGAHGEALCLDYDFNGVSGYAGLQRDLPLDYPGNYRFDFLLRGDSPANDLQFKLVDASGDNVWWVNRPKYDYPREWTPVRYKRRHISKAWGPGADPVLRASAKLEFTVYNNAGGKGSVCFDALTFTRLAADDASPLAATARVSAPAGQRDASAAVDGDRGTTFAWAMADAGEQPLVLDLGSTREFGGLVLRWAEGRAASAYDIAVSDDASDWRRVRGVRGGDGGSDWIALPESEARYIRLTPTQGASATLELAEIEVEPLDFASIPNDFIESIAKETPRGWFPRGFTGEQPYWTIVGIDGGREQGLIGEDGAIELAKGGFSIEPFVVADGKLVTWADVRTTQSLQDGYLPIPSVDWSHPAFDLRVTAFAQGTPERSQLVARYRLTNTGTAPRRLSLALVAQPFQVNPPSQFLNTTGGVSPIGALRVDADALAVDGKTRVRALQPATVRFAQAFDAGMAVSHLLDADGSAGDAPIEDPARLASGAWRYDATFAPGESREFAWIAPMTGAMPALDGFDAARAQDALAQAWRAKLDPVAIRVPEPGRALVDTLRTATAHMLISRTGPRLQPGTRSYARSWIRDGAMISEGLLRMGREDVVRDYVEWFAPYQFENGKVPCCVDDRGSDPVPENDSHGELIFNIAEYWRYTGDDAFLATMWPHVRGAFDYMEALRASERTDTNRAANPAFYGMMPVSISHEGYSAKPMHSYWDNFWALRGYKDAAIVAARLGKPEAARMAAARDEFHADLMASLKAAAAFHRIEYLPGSAELGDFDPTSTTIALAPGGEQSALPQALLRGGFERYWREFEARASGTREWKDYTPYEWRNVGAFVRLGWRERAWEAVGFFFDDRAPQAWNQWAEVVSRTPRKPFFVGDLPHAWVASDFLRSALDMFAYAREDDDSLVLAAGIPVTWFEGDGIAIHDLRTAQGRLGYALRRRGGTLSLQLDAGLRMPAGGVVFPWPYAGAPGRATIDGREAAWTNGELRIRSVPAKVEIDAPR